MLEHRTAALAALGLGAVLQSVADPGTRVGFWLLLADLALTLAAVLLVGAVVAQQQRMQRASLSINPSAAQDATALVVARIALAVFAAVVFYAWASAERATEGNTERKDRRTDPALAVSLAATSYSAKLASLWQLLMPAQETTKEHTFASLAGLPATDIFAKRAEGSLRPVAMVSRSPAEPVGRTPPSDRSERVSEGVRPSKGPPVRPPRTPQMNKAIAQTFQDIRNRLSTWWSAPRNVHEREELAERFKGLSRQLFNTMATQEDPMELVSIITAADDSNPFKPLLIDVTETIQCDKTTDKNTQKTKAQYIFLKDTTKTNHTLQELIDAEEKEEEVDLETCTPTKRATIQKSYAPSGHMFIAQTWIASFDREADQSSLQQRTIENPWDTVQLNNKQWHPVAWIVHQGDNINRGHYSIYIRPPTSETDLATNDMIHINDTRVQQITGLKITLSDMSRLAYVLLCGDLAQYHRTWRLRLGVKGTPQGMQGGSNLCYFNAMMQMLMLTDVVPTNPNIYWVDIPKDVARVHSCPMRDPDMATIKVFDQDRYVGVKLDADKGYLFAVLDGHGGDPSTDPHGTSPVADYVAKALYEDKEYIKGSNPKQLQHFFKLLNEDLSAELGESAQRFGSVAIVAIVLKTGKITIASVGDCFALLVNEDERPLREKSDKYPALPYHRINAEHSVKNERERFNGLIYDDLQQKSGTPELRRSFEELLKSWKDAPENDKPGIFERFQGLIDENDQRFLTVDKDKRRRVRVGDEFTVTLQGKEPEQMQNDVNITRAFGDRAVKDENLYLNDVIKPIPDVYTLNGRPASVAMRAEGTPSVAKVSAPDTEWQVTHGYDDETNRGGADDIPKRDRGTRQFLILCSDGFTRPFNSFPFRPDRDVSERPTAAQLWERLSRYKEGERCPGKEVTIGDHSVYQNDDDTAIFIDLGAIMRGP
jgi:serine/threonine protein phosphatase PrpC